MKRLEIYDLIREHHKQIFSDLWYDGLDNFEIEALETLNGVFYLIEHVFAKDQNED